MSDLHPTSSNIQWEQSFSNNSTTSPYFPAKLMDLGGITMMTERYEDGMRIISVDTEDEFVEALDQMTNYRVAIEAPEEIREAFGIQSAEELGIEPDDLGLPAEAYERGRWN